jgi:hypothetical protein
MNSLEFAVLAGWVGLITLSVKYFIDKYLWSQKWGRRFARLKEETGKKTSEAMAQFEERQKQFEQIYKDRQAELDKNNTIQAEEMRTHLRDKLVEYGKSIAEIDFKIRGLEEKYALNSLELQDVEYSLEELKEIFSAYYEFLSGFAQDFGLDDSKIYQELLGRTKAILDLVAEVVGKVQVASNEKNGVRTVATIGTIKAG